MVREVKEENLNELETLLQDYITHTDDPAISFDGLMRWYSWGIREEQLDILCDYSKDQRVSGILVFQPEHNRIELIFANKNFQVEKQLLDNIFMKYSNLISPISFESGYPTSWISDELSQHALDLGFRKYERQYMILEREDNSLEEVTQNEHELIPLTDLMLESISRIVFDSFNETDDQELFPFIYSTYELVLKFRKSVISGDFGNFVHRDMYSWLVKKDEELAGICFMTSKTHGTGYVMHIAVTPKYRQQGFGRLLLTHSILNLFRIEPSINGIELEVSNDNPARFLYESVGFKKMNDSETYMWKREV